MNKNEQTQTRATHPDDPRAPSMHLLTELETQTAINELSEQAGTDRFFSALEDIGFKDCFECCELLTQYEVGYDCGHMEGTEEGHREGYQEGIEDGENKIEEDIERGGEYLISALNDISNILNRINKEHIKNITEKRKRIIGDYFLALSKKFQE